MAARSGGGWVEMNEEIFRECKDSTAGRLEFMAGAPEALWKESHGGIRRFCGEVRRQPDNKAVPHWEERLPEGRVRAGLS